MFSHYLLTRFNIKKGGLSTYGDIPQTEEWLKRRFDLFEKYCFPSVTQQTVQNFTWLVLFNTETPSFFKEKINNYRLIYPPFQDLWVPPDTDEISIVKDYILSHTQSLHIITTRLDNDDLIRNNYIELIQSSFSEDMDNCFLTFREGYHYNEPKRILLKYAWEYNHFTSRVERREKLNTVYVDGDQHYFISQYGSVKIIPPPSTPPEYYGEWIEVIHECNIANTCNILSSKPLLPPKGFPETIRISYLRYIILRIRHAILARLGSKKINNY
ncbi:MAG: putative rhamnosyl transferase [Bacteroidales bacterium]|nr:putative rhamnosyl transferase [Bacteroidales bacterium]